MRCISSEARQEDRGREAVSRVEATEGALRAEIEVIEAIEAVARIVDEEVFESKSVEEANGVLELW